MHHKTPRTAQAFKALIPPLSPEEYNQLEQNILAQGCRDPIVLWRGTIIDGYNRHEICTRHNIKYETIQLRLPSREAAKLWILDNQLGRRNLTDAMRIELAARKVKLMGLTTYVNRNIARESGLSEKTVQCYMQIKAGGKPDLLEKVMDGTYKISAAHRACQQVEVITTTREAMPFTPLSPEQKKINTIKGIVDNIRRIEAMYGFIVECRVHLAGISGDIAKRIDAHFGRVGKMIGKLGGL